jgi:hypothetical protein
MGRLVIGRVEDALYAELPGYIRHVAATAPGDTTGWGDRDYWMDTSTEDSTTPGTMRRWTGSAFIPPP